MISEKKSTDFVALVNNYATVTEQELINELTKNAALAEQLAIDIFEEATK